MYLHIPTSLYAPAMPFKRCVSLQPHPEIKDFKFVSSRSTTLSFGSQIISFEFLFALLTMFYSNNQACFLLDKRLKLRE